MIIQSKLPKLRTETPQNNELKFLFNKKPQQFQDILMSKCYILIVRFFVPNVLSYNT